MPTGVLIVDDHAGFRSQARRLLESEGYSVVGEAVDCKSAVERTEALRPELALVDVYLPDGDGFELANQLLALPEPPVVILISSHDAAELAPCVERSGARGFVPKAELSRQAIEELVVV
jgi:DNA-binding NarL/FixJ family response regulator